jgi:hypothetical protein
VLTVSCFHFNIVNFKLAFHLWRFFLSNAPSASSLFSFGLRPSEVRELLNLLDDVLRHLSYVFRPVAGSKFQIVREIFPCCAQQILREITGSWDEQLLMLEKVRGMNSSSPFLRFTANILCLFSSTKLPDFMFRPRCKRNLCSSEMLHSLD